MHFLAASDNSAIVVALIGIMTTLVTGLSGALGYLIKSMSNRIDRKDDELAKTRVETTEALTKSSEVLIRVIEFMDAREAEVQSGQAASRPRAPLKSSGKRVATR